MGNKQRDIEKEKAMFIKAAYALDEIKNRMFDTLDNNTADGDNINSHLKRAWKELNSAIETYLKICAREEFQIGQTIKVHNFYPGMEAIDVEIVESEIWGIGISGVRVDKQIERIKKEDFSKYIVGYKK